MSIVHRLKSVIRGSLAVALLTTVRPVMAQQGVGATHATPSRIVGAPEVFAHVTLVAEETEIIRRWIGRPPNRFAVIKATETSPQEVFFLALSLYQKADRLCFELARESLPEPAVPGDNVDFSHVLGVVDAARSRLTRVKEYLNLTQSCSEPEVDRRKTPTDVFEAISRLSRQLNTMLDQRVGPSDVFQKVSQAVNYAARLRSRFPGRVMPETPPFEPNKRPAEVFHRLIECFDRIRDIAEASGVRIVRFDEARTGGENTEFLPSDVYDFATLIVSELVSLHARAENIKPARPSYYPGRKFPSDVYQRAGLLLAQLNELAELAQANPNWLRDTDDHP